MYTMFIQNTKPSIGSKRIYNPNFVATPSYISYSPPLFIPSTSPLQHKTLFFWNLGPEPFSDLYWRGRVYEERWRIIYGLATVELAGFKNVFPSDMPAKAILRRNCRTLCLYWTLCSVFYQQRIIETYWICPLTFLFFFLYLTGWLLPGTGIASKTFPV